MNYKNKKVILVGGSGFIGTQLALKLQNQGACVIIVDPYPSSLKNIEYIKSDLTTFPDFEALQNPEVVINLAGAPIFGRWNKKFKEKVKSSRINTTRNLVLKFKDPVYKPKFFVSTSAIGVYGDRRDELLDEDSKTIQNTYLAQVAHEWEQEALRAQNDSVEVRIVRNGHVLGRGGLVAVMKKIFMWGIGGHLGSGKQYMSFVSIEKCIETYLTAPDINATILNAVSVESISNKDFSKKLARVLRRPCLFRIPLWSIRLLYRDFGKEIVTSQRVSSKYAHQKEDITEVLKQIIRANP